MQEVRDDENGPWTYGWPWEQNTRAYWNTLIQKITNFSKRTDGLVGSSHGGITITGGVQ
jgi:hypothetical protein